MFTYLPIIYTIVVAILGACFGSFLNVVIWRVPEKMNLSYPPSHCPKCNSAIRAYDNIPIISWLLLRGKCRSCQAPISVRYPLVETFSFLSALIVAVAMILFGWDGTSVSHGIPHSPEYSNFIEMWSSHAGNIKSDPTELAHTYIEPEYLRLLAQTVGVTLVYMALLDAVLMLGFVLYDKNSVPRSLLIASVVILLGSVLYVLYLYLLLFNRVGFTSNDVRLSVFASCLWWQGRCVLVGLAAPALFYYVTPRAMRLPKFAIGALVGTVFGYHVSFPILLASELIDRALQRKFHKNLYGVVAAVLSLATLGVIAFVFVLHRHFVPVILSTYGN